MKTLIDVLHEVYGEHTVWTPEQLLRLKQLVELARADEREACAKVCDSWSLRDSLAAEMAEEIRARGETK
jgi:hypothetical protein